MINTMNCDNVNIPAGVMKLVNILDSKSSAARLEGSSPSPGTLVAISFVIGAALGDGNLSNPNGRATRLRITCDKRYPRVLGDIRAAISELFPDNKVGVRERKDGCVDVSCYSNTWEGVLGWRVGKGSKAVQNAHVPCWVMGSPLTAAACLRGLLLTDGSIYRDRGYTMVNFTSVNKSLAQDVLSMMNQLGYAPHLYSVADKRTNARTKYVVRLSKNVQSFMQIVPCSKN